MIKFILCTYAVLWCSYNSEVDTPIKRDHVSVLIAFFVICSLQRWTTGKTRGRIMVRVSLSLRTARFFFMPTLDSSHYQGELGQETQRAATCPIVLDLEEVFWTHWDSKWVPGQSLSITFWIHGILEKEVWFPSRPGTNAFFLEGYSSRLCLCCNLAAAICSHEDNCTGLFCVTLSLFKLASCALKVRNAVSPSSPSEPISVSPGVTAGFLQNHF